MSLELALRLTEIGLALAVLQRGAEHIRREPWLFVPQVALSLIVLAGTAPAAALSGLWMLGLAQLWYFRGPYNGGADKMVLLGLTCLTIARLMPQAATLALAYLAAQLLLSYVVSGWVKLRNPDWRCGQALEEVFAISAYPVSEALRVWATRRRALQVASWLVIGFELAMPIALISPTFLALTLSGAATFHLINAFVFGLNRFLWAWLAVFPSLIWLQGRLDGLLL